MSFLHPWAVVLGLAAAALPFVIHWLTRPRPTRLPLSTLRFVREALRQRRARHRLRDWLTLALRALAVVLLGWAIARPLTSEPPLAASGEEGAVARVVLLDVSQSMAARAGGIQLLERARSLAATHMADQPGLQVNLILAGAGVRPVFDRLSTNFSALREALAGAAVRPERLNVQAALNRAGELLARSAAPGQRRELVILSDFQRSSWSGVDFSALPEDTRVQLDSVAPREPLPNLAVLRVATQGRAERSREVRLEVEVGNFSTTPRQVQVEVVLGAASYRLEGTCGALAKAVLSAEVPLRDIGWLTGEARLVGVQDALPADDARPFVLEVRPAPSYVLLTRQPAEVRPSSSYYLERALLPLEPRVGRPEGQVLRMDPEHLDRETLAAAELLVLDHPGKLSGDAVRLMATLLRRGRGILYVAAEPTDAANLRLLTEAAGAELQMPVEFLPPAAGQARRNLFLVEVRKDRPPFNVLGDSLPALTGPLRFGGGLDSRMVPGGLADDVLAAYSDRSACLVASTCGAGAMGVLNADLSASNVVSSPAFVPLVGELAGRLLGQQQFTESASCGEPLAAYLPLAAGPAAGLQISGPDRHTEEAGTLVEEGGGVLWRNPAVGPPGIYQVKRGDSTVFAFAAATPAEESDLRPLDPGLLQGRLAGGRSIRYRDAGAQEDGHDDLWTWLAIGCVGCLLGELLILKLFRS